MVEIILVKHSLPLTCVLCKVLLIFNAVCPYGVIPKIVLIAFAQTSPWDLFLQVDGKDKEALEIVEKIHRNLPSPRTSGTSGLTVVDKNATLFRTV
jgi:hypothetical protein